MEGAMAQRAGRPGWDEIVEGGGIAQPFLNQQGCVIKEVVYGDDMKLLDGHAEPAGKFILFQCLG